MIIKTPSRIHMALIDLNGSYGRRDGGIGLTISRSWNTGKRNKYWFWQEYKRQWYKKPMPFENKGLCRKNNFTL